MRRWLNFGKRRRQQVPAVYVSPYDKPEQYANQLGAYSPAYFSNQADRWVGR